MKLASFDQLKVSSDFPIGAISSVSLYGGHQVFRREEDPCADRRAVHHENQGPYEDLLDALHRAKDGDRAGDRRVCQHAEDPCGRHLVVLHEEDLCAAHRDPCL